MLHLETTPELRELAVARADEWLKGHVGPLGYVSAWSKTWDGQKAVGWPADHQVGEHGEFTVIIFVRQPRHDECVRCLADVTIIERMTSHTVAGRRLCDACREVTR